MSAATSFELFSSGLGMGAFGVLLMRLTEKRFSSTQYALFSSLFALPRVAAGPVTGFAVNAIGWPTFFLATMVVGVPGLLMLHRFAPFGVREPEFETDGARAAAPTAGLLGPGLAAAVGLSVVTVFLVGVLNAMQSVRTSPSASFDLGSALWRVAIPVELGGWVQLAGIVAFALVGGMFIAATRARRARAATE
jgi:PAT family beta-lactamase induction signal transducer AmpG